MNISSVVTIVGIFLWNTLSRLPETYVEKYKAIVAPIGLIAWVMGIGGFIWSGFVIGFPFIIPAVILLVLAFVVVGSKNPPTLLKILKSIFTLICLAVLIWN